MNAPPPFHTLGDLAAAAVDQLSAATGFTAAPIERVSVRPVRAGFAYVALRLPGVNLEGIEATRDSAGHVTLRPPVRRDQRGREWPIFSLQPGLAEHAAAVVTRAWPPDHDRGAG